jgi:hypothetical protein
MCIIELTLSENGEEIILTVHRSKERQINEASTKFCELGGIRYIIHCFENNLNIFSNVVKYLRLRLPDEKSVYITIYYNEKLIFINNLIFIHIF